MAEGTDPAAELLNVMAELAEAGGDVAWQVWLDSYVDADRGPYWHQDDVQEAHRHGFIAGMAFLAGQVDAVLTTIETRAAAPGDPARVPEHAPEGAQFGGSGGPLRARGEAIDKG